MKIGKVEFKKRTAACLLWAVTVICAVFTGQAADGFAEPQTAAEWFTLAMGAASSLFTALGLGHAGIKNAEGNSVNNN
jgi:hypothetical protein